MNKEGLHELERQYFSRQNSQHKDVFCILELSCFEITIRLL